jgi:hypothetical protein
VDVFWKYAETDGATLLAAALVAFFIFCIGYSIGTSARARVPGALRLGVIDKKREVLEREHKLLLRVAAEDSTSAILFERRRVGAALAELAEEEARVIADELNLRDEEDERSGGRG